MKKSFGSVYSKLMLLAFTLLSSIYSFAQDAGGGTVSSSKSTTTSTSTATGPDANWYTSPWVWVAGGAVLVLLLVALLRGGNRTDGTTQVSKTTVTRTDTTSTDV